MSYICWTMINVDVEWDGCHWGTQLTLRIHRLNPPFGDASHEKMAHGMETGQTALSMRGSHIPLIQTLFYKRSMVYK
jgi:hypothetical protein